MFHEPVNKNIHYLFEVEMPEYHYSYLQRQDTERVLEFCIHGMAKLVTELLQ